MIPFRNEPFTNFADPANKEAMKAALAKVKAELGKEYPLVIGGEKITTGKKVKSINPGNLDEIVGIQCQANQELAQKAVDIAMETFKTWQFVEPHVRANYLFKAAAEMRRRKFEFAAWMVYEVGKNWGEADADVAEAIDFMEFYGREMIRLGGPQPLVPYEGEDNHLYYIPLGVGVVIPPWNFPLAIMVGMTTAAIVSGNTVVLKPASTSPVIAAKFVELMEQIGLPKGVINFLPGSGSEIGDFLVEHPKTRFVSFTGSRDVGIRINERIAKQAEGQIWIKRLVAEMGGKDAVVVDASADPEEAATGIVQSAFGFQGQKCSAGSRAIVHKDLYDVVLQKVVEKTKALQVGLPEENYAIGPVVDENAYNKILEYIEVGKKEGRLMAGGGKAEGNGYYIQPTIIADVKEDARIMLEEIFGPVLAFYKADSFEKAIEVFNNTEYGLTGALYSNDREHLEYARKYMHCGNLYFNRKCTGALVGVHPFGGFNMSGTDSKAGGRDYLLLFTQAKVVSERF
ncbi:L-glutamate gamma-semialdehyde dehydrogenase [Effusibacillus lacus]|uniref:L-glutamate gamma-semialdehyde dehydrogenase n=1 Tax=Effusibacillus lacus TaxID=1348429 RepID=A0A292YP52_9BACL|nr:L-glutamate gamma-semialdehyde dehydrogenase [Effusibacillus lacus]TCS72260.1 delta-1-pyrroline-5-carboxylate dehydrogenase [Effusibacillus lacus]GAX90265.1 L-glutamate gamma-semialdehyde dehydrogenase [Effusibacillus lacus]